MKKYLFIYISKLRERKMHQKDSRKKKFQTETDIHTRRVNSYNPIFDFFCILIHYKSKMQEQQNTKIFFKKGLLVYL
jgi:hypothetical protein